MERARGRDCQRYPTPGVGIARRHRVTSFIKLPEQTSLPPRVLIRVPAAPRANIRRELCIRTGIALLRRAGIISDLRLQPQFTLQESYVTETGERIRAVRYTADFSYRFGGKLVVEDVKSTATRTKEYLRNRKFMRSKFGIDIQEI